jgi:hypothetical protein
MTVRHIIVLLLASVVLHSCHNAKYHLDKFYDKGGVITCDTTYVNTTDTLYVKGADGKDSLVYIVKNTPAICPKATVETRWMVRFDNKRFKDSLKIVSNMYSDSLKSAIKNNKIDAKTSRVQIKEENRDYPWWMVFLSVMGAIFICIILTKLLLRQIKP